MKKIIVLILCLVSITIYGQNSTGIKGRVLDESNQPLPGATIMISEIKSGTSTDFNGYYEFINVPIGKYIIKISFIGYQTLEKAITIDNQIVVSNYTLSPRTNKLDEIIIVGSIAKGQAKALNQQKSKDNITNVISADQVGKFPDANIGDALKRVPGISMQNDQGEARDIIIRGLAPQLNSVTINGDRIPSAEGDNRRVQMDLIPSDMIQTIQVNKAVTPDMEADAIGGSVNLITRSAPSVFSASVTGSYGVNPIRNNPNYNFSAIVADRVLNKKLGYVVNTSFNSNDYGSDNVEFEWKEKDDKTYIGEHDIRRYDVKRNRMSASFNLDFVANKKNTFYLKSIYNQRNDWENRYRIRFRKIKAPDANGISKAKVRRQTKGGINNNKNDNSRLEEQSTYKLSLGGEHTIFNSIKLKWKTGISKAKENRPNERYIRFKSEDDIDVFQDYSSKRLPALTPTNGDFNDPTKFEFDEATEEIRYTQEKKIGSKVDVTIPLNTFGSYKNSLKFGLKYNNKEKLRDNIFYKYDDYVENDLGISSMDKTTTKDYTLDDFLVGSKYKSGIFTSNEYLGNLNFKNGELALEEFVPENYNADENIYAAYGMLKQKLSDKFSFVTGIRVEKTKIDYTGYAIDVETATTFADVTTTKGSQNYTNWLPNLQAKYKFSENTILRAAWTNTIARPNYYDLVPYQNVNSADEEASFGNPNLKATKSMNFDLMFEHYFANVGILSGGAFYKDIDNFIYNYTSDKDLIIGNNAAKKYEVTQPLNGGTAKIYGIELALQRKLNFLPGFLKNFTVYANYTYTDSETDGIKNRNDGLPLAGAVKNMLNTSLAYETSKLSVRASLNYADDYIYEYDEKAFEDTYYDEQLFLDINASYAITKKFRLFAEAKNLTNQELRFYQGTKNQTKQAEFYNYNWNVGLKYNF
jgi:TonB-dependent receptor